jgi:hypothetical protein
LSINFAQIGVDHRIEDPHRCGPQPIAPRGEHLGRRLWLVRWIRPDRLESSFRNPDIVSAGDVDRATALQLAEVRRKGSAPRAVCSC